MEQSHIQLCPYCKFCGKCNDPNWGTYCFDFEPKGLTSPALFNKIKKTLLAGYVLYALYVIVSGIYIEMRRKN